MISAGDFRNGVTLEIEGNVYQILEFQHVKPGSSYISQICGISEKSSFGSTP